MEKQPYNITQLFQKYLLDQCTPEETVQLFHYFEIEENDVKLKELINQELERELENAPAEVHRKHLTNLFDQIAANIQKEEKNHGYRYIFFHPWIRVAAVLLIVSLASLASYIYLHHTPSEQLAILTAGNLKPGSDKATLTLYNGKQVVLNDLNEGEIVKESGLIVTNSLDGQVMYHVDSSVVTDASHANDVNTMTTPRGGQYQIALADGTKVWLNASSSITFPSRFSGNNRTVKLVGEAYFEVAHDASRPFFVQTSESVVQVLGTTFNVMSYPDENVSQITLLEGSVNIKRNRHTQLLKPGQQAEIKQGNDGIDVKLVDLKQATAWKNGVFIWDQSELSQVMRQIGRWYDAEIIYDGKVPEVALTGIVSRQDSLKVLLDILEVTGGLKFDIRGNRIIVKRLN